MSSLRRRIDRILSQGEGRQLAWLAGLALTLFLILCLVGSIWALGWTEILNLYLDPGSYPLEAKSGSQTSLNFFSLLIAFGGILVLNALTVSAFSNVFENISSAYAEGRKRYPFKGHVLILGADASLERMLEALRDGESWAGREIVVMTTGETEQLRQQLSGILADRRFGRKLTFYNGDWTSAEGLSSARADRASVIYICGEKDSSAHDDSCVRCYEALREICSGEGAPIRCYMKMRDRSTLDVFRFLGTDPQCRLETEVVGTADYLAEQLLVETGFLPAFGAEDPRRLHLVVCGTAELSEAVALVEEVVFGHEARPLAKQRGDDDEVGIQIAGVVADDDKALLTFKGAQRLFVVHAHAQDEIGNPPGQHDNENGEPVGHRPLALLGALAIHRAVVELLVGKNE